jgi:hypothetical protein
MQAVCGHGSPVLWAPPIAGTSILVLIEGSSARTGVAFSLYLVSAVIVIGRLEDRRSAEVVYRLLL